MVAAPTTSEIQRWEVCDFVTQPYYMEPVTLMYQKPGKKTYGVYMKPFKVKVWLVLIGVYLTVAMTVWFTKLSLKVKVNTAWSSKTFAESLFQTYSTLFWQGA